MSEEKAAYDKGEIYEK